MDGRDAGSAGSVKKASSLPAATGGSLDWSDMAGGMAGGLSVAVDSLMDKIARLVLRKQQSRESH